MATTVPTRRPPKPYVRRDYSPSSIKTFGDGEDGCARQWGYLYIDGAESGDSLATARGTATHERLEWWFNEGIHPTDVKEWPDDGVKEFGTDIGRVAESALHNFPAPSTRKFEVEFKINASLDGFDFVGTQDLGYWDVHYDGHTNALYVVGDHKTCGDFRWMKTAATLPTDPQALIYSLAAMQRFSIDHVEARWSYMLTKRDKYKSKVTVVPMTLDHVIDTMRDKVIPIATLIRAARDEGAAATDLPQNLSHCHAYGGCPFVSRCNITASQRLGALFMAESIKEKMARIKREQSKASAAAGKVKPVETEEADEAEEAPARGSRGINPPEGRAAAGSLASKLRGKETAKGEAPKGESIKDKIARLKVEAEGGAEEETEEEAAEPTPKAPSARVTPPKVSTAPKTNGDRTPKELRERVTRTEAEPEAAPPFVLCVGCAPIGQCSNAFAALDRMHREFCEAAEVSDIRQLSYNQNGLFAAFVEENFDTLGFEGFVVVDPRVHFVKEVLPLMERRANHTIRALAF